MCMYVSEICAEGIFATFPWWLKNVKSRSKIALFSNERHFEIWFPKRRTITFFWSKLSKLHNKDTILHVATTFSLKQGETRTSHGPIPHPLTKFIFCQSWSLQITACKARSNQQMGVESYRLLIILVWCFISIKACVYFNAFVYVYTSIYRHVKSTIWKKSIHRQLLDLNKHTFLGVIWASNDEKYSQCCQFLLQSQILNIINEVFDWVLWPNLWNYLFLLNTKRSFHFLEYRS